MRIIAIKKIYKIFKNKIKIVLNKFKKILQKKI
jgi:hypothetical protein